MALSRRRKWTIVLLGVYWPALFISSHIPIPEMVEQAGVSDKTLHLLAYLILAFLLWVSLSREGKLRWHAAATRWTLLTMVLYGIIDEVSQGYVGRSCDIRDLAADLTGVLAGCVLLTVFSFWPAAVIVAGVTIFGLTNVARANLSELMPAANALFHLFGYAVFTLMWMGCMRRFCPSETSRRRFAATALGVPAALLVVVKGCSLALGREFPALDVILAVAGIVGAVGVFGILASWGRSASQGAPGED